MSRPLPTYFISRGGGPWPWVPQMHQLFATLEQSLKQLVADHGEKPKAILMVTGHWKERSVAIMGSPKPRILNDYRGYPPEAYAIAYDAPGAPAVAERARALLTQRGIEAQIDMHRGFDHSVLAVMEVMYPAADVPLFQVSILKSHDPADHIAIGRALAPLREEGVMIVGSGLSFHSLRLPRGHGRVRSAEFDAWLYDAMMADPDVRRQAIIDWQTAPGARNAHVKEEQLVPLFVTLGAAESEVTTRIYHDVSDFMGTTVFNYRFG